jgi:hypothetical protein
MGKEADTIQLLSTGKTEKTLACHVQLLVLGLRFPFACFQDCQTKASTLPFVFWQAVKNPSMHDFR